MLATSLEDNKKRLPSTPKLPILDERLPLGRPGYPSGLVDQNEPRNSRLLLRKKYFKIQANHVAPAGAQYSRESVKRKRAEQEKQHKRVQLNQRISEEKVRKASFSNHPLLSNDSELGSRILPPSLQQERQARAYVSQLHRKKLHQFEPWPDYSIQHVIRNPRSGILIASKVCFPDFEEKKWSYNRTMERVLLKEAYRRRWTVGPRVIHSSRLECFQGQMIKATINGPLSVHSSSVFKLQSRKAHTGLVSHPIRIRTTPSLWCSSACPTGDKALFAIGTSNGLHTLEGFGSHWTVSQKPFPNDASSRKRGNQQGFREHGSSSHASVSTVEWLSPEVIASGMRNSSVFLHDLRSGGSAARLQHPHAVSKIRKVDPYRLVVSGFNSLQMYDIRFAPNGLQPKPKPTSPSHTSTRPYLTFPEYSPDIISDFDVSGELGLLASASDDRRIQLFSLQTGDLIPSPLSKYQYSNPINCVSFEPSEGGVAICGPQTPSLLVCAKATVDQWAW
ncbi:hypothetical protein N7532_004405 [Penicillium argentinense]|uniref:Uncharacterized protein n=1 Tax=Penicillium argentinense TaxID=1131581 RepID=A0A9W9KFH5_9EURO|nr:uncharacterized protein N7532_004405 [Penicillium argentinense]KAJ5103876.1 hypothetical protein N7532_004405 [Penicillium argentinense]